MNTKGRQLTIGAVLVLALTALDQITKKAAESLASSPSLLIPGVLEFRYFENHGAAFSLLQNQFAVFYIGTAVILCLIVYTLLRAPVTARYRLLRFDLLLVAAGAVGNLIDRLAYHYVRDFIYVALIDFPIFNVADMYVTIGAFLFAFLLLFYYRDDEFAFLKKKSG